MVLKEKKLLLWKENFEQERKIIVHTDKVADIQMLLKTIYYFVM